MGRHQDLPVFSFASQVTFGILAVGIGLRLSQTSEAAVPSLHLPATSELVAFGTGLVATRFVASRMGRRAYRGAVLLGWLGLGLHELMALSNG